LVSSRFRWNMQFCWRSKMCHGTSNHNAARARICEPREMRLVLRTPRLEGIDPDTPSSRRFSLHRIAVAASRTLYYSRWNEGAKPCLLDKPLHRPSTINAIYRLSIRKKNLLCFVRRRIKFYLFLHFINDNSNCGIKIKIEKSFVIITVK